MSNRQLVVYSLLVMGIMFTLLLTGGCASTGAVEAPRPRPIIFIKKQPLLCHDRANPEIARPCDQMSSLPTPVIAKPAKDPVGKTEKHSPKPAAKPAAAAIAPDDKQPATREDVKRVEIKADGALKTVKRMRDAILGKAPGQQAVSPAINAAQPEARTYRGQRYRPIASCGIFQFEFKNWSRFAVILEVSDRQVRTATGGHLVVPALQGWGAPGVGYVCLGPNGLGQHRIIARKVIEQIPGQTWQAILVNGRAQEVVDNASIGPGDTYSYPPQHASHAY